MTEDEIELERRIEALLIVAEEPLGAVGLAAQLGVPTARVTEAIARLQTDYDGDGLDGSKRRGFEIREVGGGYRFYVREEYDGIVAEYVNRETPARLSQAALETLAVIAYRQPITRGGVASIRAVNVDSVVRTLVNRGLVEEVGHDPQTGAILYGTTALLLEHLGIHSVSELPPIAPLLEDGEEGFENAT